MDGVDSIGALPALGLPDLERTQGAISAGQVQPCRIVGRPDEEKKQLAKDFESVLLTKLFDEVKNSIGHCGLEDEEDGASEQVHGLFWLYLAQDVADKGGFGLWQDVYRHFQDMDRACVAGESVDREM
jgi:Rod binding domain-containing protein